MSRVYRALERAEEEKKQKGKEEPPPKMFGEKIVSKKEVSPLKLQEERVEKLILPVREETPALMVQPDSFAVEEFRKLKTQIFLRFPNPPHSVLITSATPDEGKTTVAFNLAMAISQEIHRKAILVDGDLRKPGIYLEKSQNSRGLANYLSDGTPLSEILINSETENLQIIMAGAPTHKASELIGTKRMREFMQSLSEIGDNTYIILDSPPIVSATETILLSKLVDGIILVVRADRTPRETIQRAIKSIDRQKIIGIVFNQVDLKPSSYYSKNYYRYYKK